MELLTEHRRVAEQVGHGVRQQGESAPHRVPDAGGDGAGRAAALPQACRLLDEERVAARAPVDLGDQVRVRFGAHGAGDQRGDLATVESGQRQHRRRAQQGQDERGERVVGRLHLDVPVGAHQQHPLEPRVPRRELQQPERSGVGPVQVVEDHHDGARPRDRGERTGDGVVERERVDLLGRCGLPEQNRELVGRIPRDRGPLLSRGGTPQPAHDLHPRPVSGRVVGVPARTTQHQRRLPTGLVGHAADQRGLADPGLAGHQDQAAVAVGGPGDLGAQQFRRVRSADERVRGIVISHDGTDPSVSPRHPRSSAGRSPVAAHRHGAAWTTAPPGWRS